MFKRQIEFSARSYNIHTSEPVLYYENPKALVRDINQTGEETYNDSTWEALGIDGGGDGAMKRMLCTETLVTALQVYIQSFEL